MNVPQGFIQSSSSELYQRFPTQAERQHADSLFEQNLDSVLSPRFEYSVGIEPSHDPPLTTRTAARVKAYSRVDLEEELLRVQMQRDDLCARLLGEREVKAVEAKQWKNRAQQTQELLVAERRAKATLQERVDELEQLLAKTHQHSAAPPQNHSTPTTFAFENGVLLRRGENLPVNGVGDGGGGSGGGGGNKAAAFAAQGTAVFRREDALQRTPPSPPQATAIWSPEHSARAQHIQHYPSKPVYSSSARSSSKVPSHAAHNTVTAGKVASLVGNFNPSAQHSSGSVAPHSSPSKHPRAQSEPRAAYQNHLHSASLAERSSGAGAVLAPTVSPSKGFGQERLVRIPRGEGGGVGLRFGLTQEGKVFVTEVMAGATAARFGQLRVSDEILEVDGVAVAGGGLAGLRAGPGTGTGTGSDGIAELSRLIRGPAGSILALRIRTLPYTVTPPSALSVDSQGSGFQVPQAPSTPAHSGWQASSSSSPSLRSGPDHASAPLQHASTSAFTSVPQALRPQAQPSPPPPQAASDKRASSIRVQYPSSEQNRPPPTLAPAGEPPRQLQVEAFEQALSAARNSDSEPRAGACKGSALGYWRRLEAATSPKSLSHGPGRAYASPGPGPLGRPSGSAQLQQWRGASPLAGSPPGRARTVSAGPGAEVPVGAGDLKRDDGSQAAFRFLF